MEAIGVLMTSDQVIVEVAFELVIALMCAVIGGIVALRLRQPVYLGYLGAGIVLSPFTPGHSANTDVLSSAADVAVAVLLFILAVQFPIGPIVRRPLIAILVAGQVLGIAIVGSLIALRFGADPRAAVVVGTGLATSSTIVTATLLEGRVALETRHVAVAWSLAQGAIALVVVGLAPHLAGGQDIGPWPVLLAGILLPAGFIGGRLILSFTLSRLADPGDELPQILVLAIVLIAVAGPTLFVGLPLAFAALVAGWLVGGITQARSAMAHLINVRGLFVAVFLVGLGSLFDPSALLAELEIVVVVAGGLLALKLVTATALLGGVSGLRHGRAALVGAVLAPSGEITFVLGQEGVAQGVLEEGSRQLMIGASAASIAGASVGVSSIVRDVAKA